MDIDRSALNEAVRVCACFNLRRAARAVTRLYDDVLGAGGLRSTQFVALVAIEAAGGPTLPRLAKSLGVDRSTLTRNLKPLVRADLVKLSVSRGAKSTTARLTPKGEKALLRCLPLWRDAQTRFESKVGSREWHAMLGGLADVTAAAPDA